MSSKRSEPFSEPTRVDAGGANPEVVGNGQRVDRSVYTNVYSEDAQPTGMIGEETSSADDIPSSAVAHAEANKGEDADKKSRYLIFAAMIGTSMVAMFVLTYMNTLEFTHVRWSETRFYMTFLMGAAMAVIMLTFMRGMYRSTKANIAVYIGSLVVFAAALFLVRSQTTVQDASYMRAMIPHHSIAILTSDRAEIDDVRVRELADGIIAAQRREIKEMNWLLADIRQNGEATTQDEAEARPVPEFEASP